MDAGEVARCLLLNIAALSQTPWCHHWADALHSNHPPMWVLFQTLWLIRANQLTGFDLRLGTAVLLCLCVCQYACRSVFVTGCPCLHLFISTPPSLHWQFACLNFFTLTHWTRAGPLLFRHTHHHLCVACNNSTKEHDICSNKHTGACGCSGGFKDCKLLFFVAVFWIIDLRCKLSWHTFDLGYCELEKADVVHGAHTHDVLTI